jgi:hypothetical protein
MSFQQAKFIKMKKDYFSNTYINTFINKINLPSDKRIDLINELEAALYSEEGQGYFYHLLFKSGSGHYVSVAFYLKNQDDVVDFVWSMMNSYFTLAPTMIIRRIKKTSLFRDSTWDEISYVPSNITKEEIENFFALQCTILSNRCIS